MSPSSLLNNDIHLDSRLREEEFTNILLLLSAALAGLAKPTTPLPNQLKAFEEVLKTNPTADALKALRENMSQALNHYAAESNRAGGTRLGLDPATGLEGISAFGTRIEECLSDGETTGVAVLVLDQLRALNARFGRAVGDQVLGLVAEDLVREFSPLGDLYRWNGPAFTLLAKDHLRTLESLEEKVKAIAARRIEKTVNVESRSIHIKISFSWEIHVVDAAWSVASLTRTLDDYVASRVGTNVQQ